jgi:hypothetical protein
LKNGFVESWKGFGNWNLVLGRLKTDERRFRKSVLVLKGKFLKPKLFFSSFPKLEEEEEEEKKEERGRGL